jgi:hypothetical protein
MTLYVDAAILTLYYANTASILILVAINVVMTLAYRRRMRRLEDTLDRTRLATYELTKADREDIEDLQDALRAAGIPLPRPRMEERMRRGALSPEDRHRESMERWNEVVAQHEAQWKDPE